MSFRYLFSLHLAIGYDLQLLTELSSVPAYSFTRRENTGKNFSTILNDIAAKMEAVPIKKTTGLVKRKPASVKEEVKRHEQGRDVRMKLSSVLNDPKPPSTK